MHAKRPPARPDPFTRARVSRGSETPTPAGRNDAAGRSFLQCAVRDPGQCDRRHARRMSRNSHYGENSSSSRHTTDTSHHPTYECGRRHTRSGLVFFDGFGQQADSRSIVLSTSVLAGGMPFHVIHGSPAHRPGGISMSSRSLGRVASLAVVTLIQE